MIHIICIQRINEFPNADCDDDATEDVVGLGNTREDLHHVLGREEL